MSPAPYLLLAATAAIPLAPAEIAVSAGGALAARGDALLPAIVLAGTAGAVGGDLLAYHLGRRAAPLVRRRRAGRRRRPPACEGWVMRRWAGSPPPGTPAMP